MRQINGNQTSCRNSKKLFMKTYMIKPLEWRNLHDRLFSGKYIIQHGILAHELRYEEKGAYCCHYFPTVAAAKAKAQELHEIELMEHLEEEKANVDLLSALEDDALPLLWEYRNLCVSAAG